MEHAETQEEASKKSEDVVIEADPKVQEKPEADQGNSNEEVVNPDTQEQDMDIEGDQRMFEANKRVKVGNGGHYGSSGLSDSKRICGQVYFLEDSSWEDKGTGFIEGIYDQQQDEAILMVIEEDESAEQAESGGSVAPGGFLREPENPTYLLRSRVSKGGQYSRQQGMQFLMLPSDAGITN